MSRIEQAWLRTLANRPDTFACGATAPNTRPQALEIYPEESHSRPDTVEGFPSPPSRSLVETDGRWWCDFPLGLRRKLIVTPDASLAAVEEFLKLGANLHQQQGERRLAVLLVASALPGEGKTLTAVNLALTLSASFRRRVLLIDADIRRPTVHELLRIDNSTGLVDELLLASHRAPRNLQVTTQLVVLPAGRPCRDPIGLLSSGRMRELLTAETGKYDWVILDSAPINLLSDARLIAQLADGVLIVVRARQTRPAPVSLTIDLIGRDRVLGVVLNGRTDIDPVQSYYYQQYQAP